MSSSCTASSKTDRAAAGAAGEEAFVRLAELVAEIRACQACAHELAHPPRPVLRVDPRARIAVAGQAPGARVHAVGAPFVDPSGVRLRAWMGVDESVFYDPALVAVVPAGFCFPGLTASGADKPPPKRCAELWRARVFDRLPHVRLIVLAGAHAVKNHLGAAAKPSLTETVQAWRAYAPRYAPIPHPSWRNNAWMKKNPWFESELLADLKARVAAALA